MTDKPTLSGRLAENTDLPDDDPDVLAGMARLAQLRATEGTVRELPAPPYITIRATPTAPRRVSPPPG